MTYMLQKIVEDEANDKFGQVWNQELVLSVNCSAEDVMKAASDTKYVTLRDFMSVCNFDRVCWQHGGESESDFIQRAEKQIEAPIDFVIETVRSADWKLNAIRLLKVLRENVSYVVYDNAEEPFMTVSEIQHV